jgi:hypothetical protein
MNKFATFALLLLAAGLVAFIALTDTWRFSQERLGRAGEPLFRFDPSRVESVTIGNGDQSFRLERSPTGWRMTGPINDEASPEAVAALMRTALDTLVLDRIEAEEIPDEKNLAAYGVLKSTLRLDFQGDQSPLLLIGKKSVDGARHYVSFENGREVYLIPDTLGTITALPPSEFRDRRVLAHPPNAIDRVTLRNGPAQLELERTPAGWRIVKPLTAKADDEAVATFLDRLAKARIVDFPKTSAIDRPTGMDAFELTLHAEGDGEPTVLRFAPPTTGDSFPARILPRRTDALLPPTLADLAAFDIDSFRDRSVFPTNPDLVDLVRIKKDGTTRTITRANDSWQAAPGVMEDFFATLARTRAKTFLPATPDRIEALGLNSPVATISMVAVLSENTPEAPAGEHPVAELAVGAPLGDGTAAVRATGSPEIMIVPEAVLEAIP